MNKITVENIKLDTLKSLVIEAPEEMVELPDEVYKKRFNKLLNRMREENLDCLVFYADKEHYSNFRFFAGFEPRFEEGLMIIHKDEKCYVLLGNECYGMYRESKIPVEPILCQILSLPNQTMDKYTSMEDMFTKAGISPDMKVGVIGWKLFTGTDREKNKYLFDIPFYMLEALRNIVEDTKNIVNATPILISPDNGIRVINDVHTIATLEYGAAHASHRIKELIDNFELGKSETELAKYLNPNGLVLSCHPILAAGKNRFRGLISPTDLKLEKGMAFSCCMGLEGGLSSRCGYVAETIEDLPEDQRDYLEVLAKPYYATAVAWYEKVAIGVTGGEIFDLVESIIPQKKFGWVLNPGHLIGTEEWLSSPVYPKSSVKLQSGMIIQMDISPDGGKYSSPGAEDGVCIADEALQQELKNLYPKVWERMMKRRKYMIEELGINLHSEILPMSNLAGEYRPLLLNKKMGFIVRKNNC